MKPTQTVWTAPLIKAAIETKFGTGGMAALATQQGVNAHSVRAALRRPLKCGEQAISEALGIELNELWPDRWEPNGVRIRPRYAKRV